MSDYRPASDVGIGALSVCPVCGVVVADREAHDGWHASEALRIEYHIQQRKRQTGRRS